MALRKQGKGRPGCFYFSISVSHVAEVLVGASFRQRLAAPEEFVTVSCGWTDDNLRLEKWYGIWEVVFIIGPADGGHRAPRRGRRGLRFGE